ncbi:hypothetical protein BJV74DRAFT_882791 [Russula compacta]|nr:hypothetical protein BJV74DRAFT_882791 [Russula compacta]
MIIPKLPSLPKIEISPVPEQIFLSTAKGILSFVIHLSLLDLFLIAIIILLVNASPSIRQRAVVSLGFLLLIFGLEVSFINVYTLLCSWLSPSTTLEPLTEVILGNLNSVTPIITDSVLLAHIVIERIEHSKSYLRLAVTMAAPVLLKFGRLANAAIYIMTCAEFVLSSVTTGDGVPDMDILNAAQARSMNIASALQMVDNSYQLAMYYLNAFEQRRMSTMQGLSQPTTTTTPAAATPESLRTLFLASAGNFLLPILLSAAQLAASRAWPDSNVPRDIERVKVVVNVAGAAATSLIAALKRWRLARATEAKGKGKAVDTATTATWVDMEEATERTALMAGQGQTRVYSKRSESRRLGPGTSPGGEKIHVMFDAGLIDVEMKEDQAHMDISLPVL